MKHWDLLDSRIPLAIALCLTAAAVSAQDGIGQAHDSVVAQAPIILGELALAGDIAAPRMTRSIEADFYGAADSEDWYNITLRDAAFHPACIHYKSRFQAELSGLTPPGPGQQPSLIVHIDVSSQALDLVGSPTLAIVEREVTSCGSGMNYLLRVTRPPTQATTPAPYVLNLWLDRAFFGGHISAISPTSGPIGTAVTITGSGLLPQVAFQGVAAPLNTFSATSITTSVPPGALTGPVTVHSMMSQQVFTVTSSRPTATDTSVPRNPRAQGPRGPGSANLPQTALPTAPGATPCCATEPNPALAGRLGRLVVEFPTSAVPTGTKVGVLKDGNEVQAGYGSQTWDLLPGTYDVSVGGKVVSSVPVHARADTRVRVGVLRVFAGDQTRAEIVDGSAVIASGYGEQLVGLPAGSYGLRISGATESFTIQDGQLTDF